MSAFNDHVQRANAAISVQRYEVALQEAGAAIAADPSDPAGHVMLGVALISLKRVREALAAIEAGLGEAPDDAALHRLRSLALNSLKKRKEALDAADEAVRLEPEAASSHESRGRALSALKRRDEARAAFEEAVRLAPGDADYRRELGDEFLESAPRTAEKHYRASLEIDPNDAVTLNNLGVALEKQKRPFEAAAAYKAAVVTDPTFELAKRNVQSTVGGLMKAGGGSVLGVWLFVRVASLVAKGPALAVFAIVALLGVLIWLFVRSRNDRERIEGNRERLQRMDPQIYEIYRKLEAEKKWRWRK